MKVSEIRLDIGSCEASQRGLCFVRLYGVIVDVVGRPERIYPQMGVDGCWPALLGMEEHGPCVILEVPDPLLHDPILEVCVHSTKS